MEESAPQKAPAKPRLAYLFSRYPVVSQTFCDSEMMALENRGFEIVIGSINPPLNTFRHERFEALGAEAFYPPPPRVLEGWKRWAESTGEWQSRLGDMIARHDRDYGASFKAATRARNGVYFAERLKRLGVDHVHVHFANRATHTALFMKAWSGLPFSFTAHAQDFMVDLGSDDLLRELCREARFVVAVSDFSEKLLQETCPESAEKIQRVYNGIAPDSFPLAEIPGARPLRIVTIGRLIEFKGFHHLIAACGQLKEQGVAFELCLIGEGPWRERLESQVKGLELEAEVEFAGVQTREAVKARLADADVFALACIVDAKGASDILPTVIMEAMACQLPVVSTRLVGVPEMVEDGETGLLVEPGDEKALAEALASLAGDQGLARELGAGGRRKAMEIFDQRVTSAELAERFERTPLSNSSHSGSGNGGLLYILDTWPVVGDKALEEELNFVLQRGRDDMHLLAASTPEGLRWDPDVIESWGEHLVAVEFLPDAMVLEAEWKHQPNQVEKVLALRQELGSEPSTEVFLTQARRALLLARLAKRRGVRHLHAARSSSLLMTWLAHHLSGIPFSATTEAEPAITGKPLHRMVSEALLTSRGDLRLENPDGSLDEKADLLGLAPAAQPGHVKIGPIKMRRSANPEPVDRSRYLEPWLKTLRDVARLKA